MGNSTLVGGFNPSEKYESHLGLIIVPNISKKHVPNNRMGDSKCLRVMTLVKIIQTSFANIEDLRDSKGMQRLLLISPSDSHCIPTMGVTHTHIMCVAKKHGYIILNPMLAAKNTTHFVWLNLVKSPCLFDTSNEIPMYLAKILLPCGKLT